MNKNVIEKEIARQPERKPKRKITREKEREPEGARERERAVDGGMLQLLVALCSVDTIAKIARIIQMLPLTW